MATNLSKRKPRAQGQRQSTSVSGTGASGNGREVSKDDNYKAVREAEQAQLLSIMSQLRAKETQVNAKKAELKEVQDEFTEIVRLAKVAGFQKYELMDLLKDVGAKRRDITEAEERRHRFRQYLGLPVGKTDEQLELEQRLPATAKDEAFWRGDGYTAGLRGDSCQPPAECGVHGQAWMEEWGRGQQKLIMSMQRPAAAEAPEPDKDDAEKTRAELKAEEKRAKESLAQIGQSKPDDDGFDMSEEERQQQTARRVVQEQREAGVEEPEPV